MANNFTGQISLFDDDLFGDEGDAFIDFGAAKAAAEEEKKKAAEKKAAEKKASEKKAASVPSVSEADIKEAVEKVKSGEFTLKVDGTEKTKEEATAFFASTKQADIASVSFEEADEGDEDSKNLVILETKKASEKKTAKKKPQKKGVEFNGPVTVVGFGWEYNFTPIAGKATTKDILEAALKAGYEEVGMSSVKSSYLTTDEGKNFIFLSLIAAKTPDDALLPEKVKVVVGQMKSEFAPADCGVEADEFTSEVLCKKYCEVSPLFSGNDDALKGVVVDTQTGVAMPYLESVKPEELPSGTYTFFKEGGNVELEGTGKELAESLTAPYGKVKTVLFYKASSVYFVVIDTGVTTGCTGEDIVPHKSGYTPTKTAEKKYELPFAVYFTVTGQYLGKDKVSSEAFELTAEDFGGKARVTEQEVFDLIKGNNPCFSLKGKTFPMMYMESEKTYYIGMAMGKLGGFFSSPAKTAANVIPFRRPLVACGIKTLDLPIGEFKGEVTEDMEVSKCLGFKRNLPKVPFALLQYAMAYFRQDLTKESIVYIVWNTAARSYQLRSVDHTATKVAVEYGNFFFSKNELPVIQIHSHNTMPAIFSGTDDKDQVITGLYGVIGNLDTDKPSVAIRVSFEGKYKYLPLSEIFEDPRTVA